MRHHLVTFLATSAFALGLTGCANNAPAPAEKQAAPAAAPAPAPAAKAPQCWNGDSSKFENLGSKAVIAGVAVTCEATADGKSAQWMGAKKH